MDIKELQKQVYDNTINLGYTIDKETTIDKLQEELIEFEDCKNLDRRDLSHIKYKVTDKDFKNFFEEKIKGTESDEIPDMIFVLMSYCEENNINLESLIKNKLRYNSLRNQQLL